MDGASKRNPLIRGESPKWTVKEVVWFECKRGIFVRLIGAGKPRPQILSYKYQSRVETKKQRNYRGWHLARLI